MEYYKQTIANAEKELHKRRLRNKPYVVCEVLIFLIGILMLVLFTTEWSSEWQLVAIALSIVAYLFVRKSDLRNSKAIGELEDTKSVCEAEEAYLNGDYGRFQSGKEYADAKHPFALDLDIFGKSSLFQRVCRGVTTAGCDAIAGALKLTEGANCERQHAISSLAGQPELLTEFKRWGQRGVVNTDAVLRAFHNIESQKLPSWARGKAMSVIINIYTLVYLLSLAASIIAQSHLMTIAWWSTFNFFVAFLACNRSLISLSSAVGGLAKQLATYRKLIEIIDRAPSSDPIITGLKDKVNGAGESLKALDNTLQKLESRSNILGLIIFDTLFLWDFRILNGFATWRRKHENHFSEWIKATSEFDMLVSFATFKYNEAAHTTCAEIIASPEVVFKAKGIYHPFLGAKAVRNNFTIDNRNFYIITGANMAGKSTFLRSLGINYVLAMNGLPVFADRLTVSVFDLFTSMRTTDDLTNGISYFNAELTRLRQILDSLSDNKPHLIILDEILKGTNSDDKLSGSRMFLEYVANKNVTGVIATHDLKLSEMSTAHPGRFHNYCFEIALGTNITYSYKISPGVARNQNATFLLKQMLGKAPS